MLLFFSTVGNTLAAMALEQVSLKCNGYELFLKDNVTDEVLISVYKNHKSIFEIKDQSVLEIENYCTKNFLGNGTPIIVISTWSGGAHCCNTSYFLMLDKKFHLMQRLETYDSSIKFVPQGDNKPYKISVMDVVFKYFYTSFASSVFPEVMMKFNGNSFVFDKDVMVHKINQQEFRMLLLDLEKKLDKENDFTDFLDKVVKLIYSGNTDLALKLTDIILYKYDFNKLQPAKFKLDLLCRLKNSQYITDLVAINDNNLVLPDGCKQESLKNWVDYRKFRKNYNKK